MKLLIAPCEHKAARFAVETWHYSKTMPVGRLAMFGAWEDGVFVGAVIFGRGANLSLGSFLGLGHGECCELVRVALNGKQKTPTSKILAISIKVFARLNNGVKAIISFADPEQGHNGCIYRATNWLFVGFTTSSTVHYLNGEWLHNREVTSGAFGKQRKYTKEQEENAPKRKTLPKIKYVYCLDKVLLEKVAKIALPYSEIDKRYPFGHSALRVGGVDSNTPASQAGEGGATPTPTLLCLQDAGG